MTAEKPRTVILPDPNAPDWPSFWASLSDADCAAALRAAPRVAGEWEEDGAVHFRRQATLGADGDPHADQCCCSSIVAARYGVPWMGDGWWWEYRDATGHMVEPRNDWPATADLARTACDAALRAAGWRVL